jgi:hypothetical protein
LEIINLVSTYWRNQCPPHCNTQRAATIVPHALSARERGEQENWPHWVRRRRKSPRSTDGCELRQRQLRKGRALSWPPDARAAAGLRELERMVAAGRWQRVRAERVVAGSARRTGSAAARQKEHVGRWRLERARPLGGDWRCCCGARFERVGAVEWRTRGGGRPGELGAARAWWIWGSRVLAAVQTYTVRGKNETCAPVGPNVGATIFVRRLSAHLTTNCWSGLFPDRSYFAYYTKYRPKLRRG